MPRYEAPDPEVETARARRRVGTTPESRTRWLLRFETLDLAREEKRALRYELSVFLYPSHERHPSFGEEQEEKLSRIQETVRSGLSRLKEGRGWALQLQTYVALWIPRPEQSIGSVAPIVGQGRTAIQPKEPNRLHSARADSERISHVICRTLEAVGPRLRRCALPGCLMLFVQRGRQRFCTATHAARYRTRKRRGTLPLVPPGPDARRGVRHYVPWVERQKRGRGWSRARELNASAREEGRPGPPS